MSDSYGTKQSLQRPTFITDDETIPRQNISPNWAPPPQNVSQNRPVLELDEPDGAIPLFIDGIETSWLAGRVSWKPYPRRGTIMASGVATFVLMAIATAIFTDEGSDVALDTFGGAVTSVLPSGDEQAREANLQLTEQGLSDGSEPTDAQPDPALGSSAEGSTDADTATDGSGAPATTGFAAAATPPTLPPNSAAATSAAAAAPSPSQAPSTAATPTTAAPDAAPTPAAPSANNTNVQPNSQPAVQPVASGAWDYYGNPWVPSSLANLEVKNSDRYSYRFVAKHSGTMTGFQNYMQANTSRLGYASGNGGTIQFSLVHDDGSGKPDENRVLAETVWKPGLNNGTALPPGSDNYTDSHHIGFADKYFDQKPTLQAGATYHLVIKNIDSNPGGNYISINSPWAVSGRTRSPFGPTIADWGVLQNQGGGGWNEYTEPKGGSRYEVNLMILMEDGNHYGNSYMDPRDALPISGSNKLRQLFTPDTTHNVDQLAVFTSGSGKVEVTLKEGDATIGTWSAETSGENHSVFSTGPLALKKGSTYSLEFGSSSGNLSMLTFRDGSLGIGYTYPKGGSWHDGHVQTSSGSGWSDSFFTYADIAGVTFHTTN